MQSRRREEQVAVSPASRSQHRPELGPDPYRRTRRDGLDHETVRQRNLSPQKIDELRRGVGANQGTDGFGRRDRDWHLGGHRSSRVRSRSPPSEQARKRSNFNDGVRRRSCSPPLGLRPRYEVSKIMEYDLDVENLDAKRVYGYDHDNCRVHREKDSTERRLGGGQGMLDHKLMVQESEARGPYRLVPDTGLTSQYEETCGHLPPFSRTLEMGRFEHGRQQHRDPISSDKIPVAESYKGVEKTVLHAREVPCTTISPSYTKDYASTSQLRDYGSTSLGMPRSDILCSHHDGNHLPTYYELPRSSEKLTEPVGFTGYVQRPPMDSIRDPEPGQRNMCDQRCAYSPTWTEHVEYLDSKLQVAPQDEHGYQYDDLHRRIAPHGRLNYEQAQMEYKNRELPRSYIMHHVLDRTDKGEDSYGIHRRGSINDHPALQKPKYVAYPDMSETSIVSKQGEDYLDSGYNHLEIDRRMPQEYEASYLGVSEADHSSILRSEYDSQRNGGPGLQQERFQSNPLTKHNSETHRHAARVQDMKLDLGIHGHSHRQLKRNYDANDDIYVCDSRTMKSCKWDELEEFQDPYEGEEWIDDEEMDVLYSSGNVAPDHKFYRKDKREYNRLDREEDIPSDDWLSSQDSMGYTQRHTFQFRKYSGQKVKSHSRFNSSSWNKPQPFSKRNAIHKQPKVWKKYHGYDETVHTNNDESSEDRITATESEPSEGSDEFNQLVQEAFLMYSKKLNVNTFVQRRYKEQGKAGSLFCIVCGRRSVFFSVMLFL